MVGFRMGMALAGLVLGQAVGAQGEDLAFPLRAQRILFLGDSITHAGGYIDLIEAQVRLQQITPAPELINLGLPSETCSGLSEPDHPFPRPNVHERIDRALAQLKPDVVVACYGMNDGIYHPFSKERFAEFQKGINAIIDKVQAAEAKLVLMTPPAFDPLPLRKKGKLLPAGQEKYAWFSIYEDYDEVLKKYAAWVMQQADRVEMVIDLHTPVTDYVARKRQADPEFTMSPDGVHVNQEGHGVLAQAILEAWGIPRVRQPDPASWTMIRQRQKLSHNAWLSAVGHQRPGMKPGLPLDTAQTQAAELDQQIKARMQLLSRERDAADKVHHAHFPASSKDGELSLFVDYFLWIPPGVETLRGVIVHQHGCGVGASIGGLTAADDLHWRELARRWDCALLGSSYEARAGASCRLWCDSRNGSDARFLQALNQLARDTGHPELATVPWCLWGHSGGGFWASLMQVSHPERIVAIWLQSGTALGAWQRGEIEAPAIPETAYTVPVMACPGLKEKDHERFQSAWNGLLEMTKQYRANGAPFGFAPDPRTGHECGDSRYLAIPFFDACLTQRLPDAGDSTAVLKPIDWKQAQWGTFAGTLVSSPTPASPNRNPDWVWLPDENVAAAWQEFLQTGSVSDPSPPSKPFGLSLTRTSQDRSILSWHVHADRESGLQGFRIEQAGRTIASIPVQPMGRFGRPLYQGLSYHDTPEQPLPRMQAEVSLQTGPVHVYSVNSVGLESEPAEFDVSAP